MKATFKLDEKFLHMPFQDSYFICQAVDTSLRNGMAYARNIEDFMGDMACRRLLYKYPKFTPFHEYIELVVDSVIWEQASRTDTCSWVDYLFKGHGIDVSYKKWQAENKKNETVEEYLEFLREEDILPTLVDSVTKEVFHILFSNRSVLKNFGTTAAYYVQEVSPGFYPEFFVKENQLRRAPIPKWAKDAIFHRDKGICVGCKADLTRLVNQQNALHFDHIIPLAKGGMNDVTNLQLLCENCNLTKSHRHSEVSTMYESWYQY